MNNFSLTIIFILFLIFLLIYKKLKKKEQFVKFDLGQSIIPLNPDQDLVIGFPKEKSGITDKPQDLKDQFSSILDITTPPPAPTTTVSKS